MSYLPANTTDGSDAVIYTQLPKHIITGSGIVIITPHTNKNGRTDLAIILFRDVNTGLYQDLGGTYSSSDYDPVYATINTAIREANEESANLFKFNKKSLLSESTKCFAAKYHSNILYVSYHVYVKLNTSILPYVYSVNRDNLVKNNANHVWLETDDIQFFFISDIKNYVNNNNFSCPNTDGTLCNLSNRAYCCIQDIYKTSNNIAFLPYSTETESDNNNNNNNNKTCIFII